MMERRSGRSKFVFVWVIGDCKKRSEGQMTFGNFVIRLSGTNLIGLWVFRLPFGHSGNNNGRYVACLKDFTGYQCHFR